MPMSLLETKLYIPPPRPHLVARPAVTAKLSAGVLPPLTLIAAPAGFGKTTLVSEWITQTAHAVAWLSLDEDDDDPVRFLTYVMVALQTQQPQLGATAQALLSAPEAPSPKAILTLLLNELGVRPTPLVLVLDDYHLIENPVSMTPWLFGWTICRQRFIWSSLVASIHRCPWRAGGCATN